jgi:hypothetical protein
MRWLALLLPLATVGMVRAENTKVLLKEEARVDGCFSFSSKTCVEGSLRITREGKTSDIPVAVDATHRGQEKWLQINHGRPAHSARRYEQASSKGSVGEEKVSRFLRPERSLVVARADGDATIVYSPGGPMQQQERELASEFPDTLQLPRLLPERFVEPGATWELAPDAVTRLCQFDALIENKLTAKFLEQKAELAIITITGKTQGIEAGAAISQTIDARLTYDVKTQTITQVDWKQKDERGPGPVSPASQLTTRWVLERQRLAIEPALLNKAALVGVAEGEIPPLLLLTTAAHEAGQFTFLHSRDWHVVSQTPRFMILRLLQKGEFLSQVSLVPWEKKAAGQRVAVEQFKKSISESKSWVCEEIVDAGQVASDDERWIYRVAARGTLDGMAVLQTYYIMASPGGQHLGITFTCKLADANKLGTKDLELVNSVSFR